MKQMSKDKIVEAARKLFYKYGFKKVSMDEIANEAGVTKRTIYMYFKSKEDLLKYFIQEEIENMKEIVEEVEKKNKDFFETANEAIYKLLKYRKERDFLNIITKEAEWLKNPIIIKNLQLIDEQIQNYIREKLQKAKEKGYKNGYVLWPIRTALSGKQMTPAGATEILEVLGKEESVKRIQAAIEKLGGK